MHSYSLKTLTATTRNTCCTCMVADFTDVQTCRSLESTFVFVFFIFKTLKSTKYCKRITSVKIFDIFFFSSDDKNNRLRSALQPRQRATSLIELMRFQSVLPCGRVFLTIFKLTSIKNCSTFGSPL